MPYNLKIIDRKYLNNLIRKAGGALLNVFISEDFGVEIKRDNSPLKMAKKASYEIIVPSLKERFPSVPVISEKDNNTMPFKQREKWELFWMVDPLNGTKGFIKREKDFTVNIALIQNGTPVWGIVFAPALDWLYYGGPTERTKKEIRGDSIRLLPFDETKDRKSVVAVRSKFHSQPGEEIVLQHYAVTNTIYIGSSLKFCLVAEGTADIYFRAGPTWEWDTAAAHAVILGADCVVLSRNLPLYYNKSSLKNDFGFLCLRENLMKKPKL